MDLLRRFWTLLALTFALNAPATVVVPYDMPSAEGPMTVLVLLPNDHFRLVNPFIDAFDTYFLDKRSLSNIAHSPIILSHVLPAVQQWYIAHQKNKGALSGAPSSSMADLLQTIEGIHQGRFALVVFFDRDNLSKIRAVVRFVTPTPEHPHHPFQVRLAGRGLSAEHCTTSTKVSLEIGTPEPLFRAHPFNEKPEVPISYEKSTWWGGVEQSVTTWATTPSALIPWAALSFILAEIHKVSRRSGWTVDFDAFPDWQKTIDLNDSPTALQRMRRLDSHVPKRLRDVLSIPSVSSIIHDNNPRPTGNQNWLQLASDLPLPDIYLSEKPSLGVRVSSYVIEFDVLLRDLLEKKYTLWDHYKKMGWKIVDSFSNPDMPAGVSQTFIARIDRRDWVQSLGRYFGRQIFRSPFRELELRYRENFAEEMGWLPATPSSHCPEKVARFPLF